MFKYSLLFWQVFLEFAKHQEEEDTKANQQQGVPVIQTTPDMDPPPVSIQDPPASKSAAAYPNGAYVTELWAQRSYVISGASQHFRYCVLCYGSSGCQKSINTVLKK